MRKVCNTWRRKRAGQSPDIQDWILAQRQKVLSKANLNRAAGSVAGAMGAWSKIRMCDSEHQQWRHE
jgi:hypothetical protein